MSDFGFCLPVKSYSTVCRPIAIKLESARDSFREPWRALYISYSEEENTVRQFLDALRRSRLDDAMSYVSKNYVNDFDLAELSDFFHTAPNYKTLIKVEFTATPKNRKTNSILVLGAGEARGGIVHLHMIKEPDRFGKWKIYGIEKEQ